MAYIQNLTQTIATSYLLATGKSTVLAAGTSKYNKIVALANYFTQLWANEPGEDWASLRSTFALGTITAGNSVAIDTDIGHISNQEGDYIRVLHLDGIGETDYSIVPIERLYDGMISRNAPDGGRCAVSGSNLIFEHSFISQDAQFGGTIQAPGYLIPDTLANGNDVIRLFKH